MNDRELTRRQPFGDNPQVGERGASTQRRILDAGLAVFAEHGYHDAAVELVTKEAGCSRPAFYQYFSGKEDLFWHLAGRMAREMADLADRIKPSTPDEEGLDHIRSWLESLVDLSITYDPVMTGFQAAVRERAPDAKQLRQIGGRLGGAILASAGRDHPELDVSSLANVTVGVLQRTVFYWQYGVGGLPRSRLVTGLARSVHRLLHGRIDGLNDGRYLKATPRTKPNWPELADTSTDEPRRPRGRQTRQQLLNAGRSVLPVRGYHGTRVDDIAAAAGVSHGSFYRYFSSTDDLFHTLAQEAAVYLIQLVDGFPEDVTDDAIHDWLEGWFGSYGDHGGVITAWQELDHDDPELARFSIDVAIVVLDRLTRIVQRRGFGDSAVDALMLLSVIERMPYSVLVLGHLGQAEAIDASVFLLRRGVFGHDY